MKNLKVIILYVFVIIFSLLILLYAVNKMKDEFEAFKLMILFIGEIFILYGGIWIWRNVRQDSMAELLDGLRKLEKQEDDRKEVYGQIYNIKRNISYLRHDMANHIHVIKAVISNVNIKEINNIEELLQKTTKLKYCDNYMLDIAIEQKLRELEERNIITETDIRLREIENIKCYEFCIIFWLLTDNVARFLKEGEKIYIKIHNRKECPDDKSAGIIYRIEGHTKKVKKRRVRKSAYMYIAERMLDKEGGSVVSIIEEGRITEAGICELKERMR